MNKVIQLVNGIGLSPALKQTSESLHGEIWEAVDRAIDNGITVNMLIGQLEIIKASLVDRYLKSIEASE